MEQSETKLSILCEFARVGNMVGWKTSMRTHIGINLLMSINLQR